MSTGEEDVVEERGAYPGGIAVRAATTDRNRLTTAFRFFLAIPHMLLVGGPLIAGSTFAWNSEHGVDWGMSGSGGLLGAVACVAAMIAWFAILFTGRYPEGLYRLATFYLRWRIRATAYLTLLRDEYPPFGDAPYPAELVLVAPEGERDRLTVAFRILLALPHIVVLWFLSLAWALTTAIAWVAILLTGTYPETLYGFAIGVMAWSTRVEAYLLLLRDEYPPFTLRVSA